MNNLDEYQRYAVEATSNTLLIAGAGAGKTYSLVHRSIESLENGVKTSEVVAITFTNKSAEK